MSFTLPPSRNSHGAILYRLLHDVDPTTYCMLSSGSDEAADSRPDNSFRLRAPRYQLSPPYQITRGYRFGFPRLKVHLNKVVAVVSRARAMARIMRAERCDAVVACTGGSDDAIIDFPAAFIASRMLGIPFHAYLLDQYVAMVSVFFGKSFVRYFERLILKGAASVITHNDFHRDALKSQYGIHAIVIHNPADLSEYGDRRTAATRPMHPADTEVRVVYTGSVGIMYIDALQNMVTALDLLGRDDVRLHLYTLQSRNHCESAGVVGKVTYHEAVPIADVPRVQQDADILFFPLAFRSPYREHLRTTAPGKMSEYVAAGRPILAHVPAGSFSAWYFHHHECGLVVDQDDPEALARALERLIGDVELQDRLSANARRRAEVDFSETAARERFLATVSNS